MKCGNMKKICENCGNYTIFHTKIGLQYFQTTCGRCWANKTITGLEDTCNKWEAKPVSGSREQEELIIAFDTVITNLSVIKAQLTKE